MGFIDLKNNYHLISHAFKEPAQSSIDNASLKKSSLLFSKSKILEETIQSIKTLEDNSIFPNEIIVLYDTRNFNTLYVSQNVEKILGYTQKEFLHWESAITSIGAYNQPKYFSDLLGFGSHFKQNFPHTNTRLKIRAHICGLKFKRKDKSECQFLVREESNLGENLQVPEFNIAYFSEISHLIKGSEYWMLFEAIESGKSFSKFYRADGVDNIPITAREQEVLTLIAAGKITKEVAQELHISPDTVGQHRKNMIKKLMAKDTSALIQLCKKCEII